ncbi:hypothetical protein KXX33_009211 [Aspergillus fumigatus]|nr:hypothetical protein CNMCM8686_006903 [Aspergillus fumigatus]KAH1290815.1 hypothetical protein KXX48_007689 [Aspergillus fumigatus]KAH1365973.1 hypothetical protein KXX33_009211 [Aspergillus fumigatus]KAH1472550.1 hypothetical protein KXX53_007965 [Aspergillus fumigatus]KAH1506659.1 hypothetical protein KXX52_000155 [Aspergillus fumigatus]
MGNRKKTAYSKTNGESNMHMEEPQGSGLEGSPPRDAQIEYNQPESSPYESPIATVHIGRRTYMIPVCYIEKYPQFDTSLIWQFNYNLSEVDEEVGHTIAHFLCTGSYETLRTTSDSGLSNVAIEYRRSMLVYHAARKYDLYDLEVYAKKYIQMFGQSMSAFDSMEAARKIYSKLPRDEAWLPSYLHERLRLAFLMDANIFQGDEFYDGVGKDPDFDKAVMRMVVNIYSEALSKQGTAAVLEETVAEEGVAEEDSSAPPVAEEDLTEPPFAEEAFAEEAFAEPPVAEVVEDAASFSLPAEPSRITLDLGWGKVRDTGSKTGLRFLDAGNGHMEKDTNGWHSNNEAGESVGFSVPPKEVKSGKKNGKVKKTKKSNKKEQLAEPVRTSSDNWMNNDSFHYFSQLPPELRRLIWTHSLPHRIAEEDIPVFLLDGNEARQACWARRITHQNAQPPTIAFVNRESRQVALEHGRWLESQETTSLDSIWVQPRRDVLHLNWTRMRYNVWGNADDPSSPIAMFLWRAESLGMPPSVVAEIIHPFRLKALLEGAEGADASDSPWLLYRDGTNNDVADIAYCAESQRRLDVAMAAVSLHIPPEAARRSGLFGLLGDAPVQMVDVGDVTRLRQFQALFVEHALAKEPAVQALFEALAGSRFQSAVEVWQRQAEWIILAYMWQRARMDNDDLLGTDPGSAWVPYLPEREFLRMSEYLPDEKHPWVKQARQSAPQLRPRIMVRYCTNECYLPERLPKHFGTY